MVWKQDLAKLKQQLKEDGDPPSLPPQKPILPPSPSRPIVDEDATFLAAMGKPAPTKVNPGEKTVVSAMTASVAGPVPAETEAEFQDAIGGLLGLRPLGRNPVLSAPTPTRRGVPVEPIPLVPDSSPEASVREARLEIAVPDPLAMAQPPSPKAPPGPRLIHLAAGMAVEVDAILDLRGHSVHDGKERLKERLQDATVLGWRTLHVILGPSEALRQAFLAFLMSPPAKVLAQYAQAPIPMGGNQAFIVYIAGPTA